MGSISSVGISRDLLQAIFESAGQLHPRETILLLRGKKNKESVKITELVVPPLATYGRGFAEIRLHMLPIDFSIVGAVHSHPSGNRARVRAYNRDGEMGNTKLETTNRMATRARVHGRAWCKGELLAVCQVVMGERVFRR